jgi:COP9 signalosome complex subunit 5
MASGKGLANLKTEGDGKMSTERNSGAHSADARYYFDTEEMEKFKKEKPWMKNPKHFQKIAIAPSAVIKIMMHCQSGVEKGIAKGGNPIEVMGMLLGRPDPTTPDTLVVADAFPLPIEGFETRVVADDQEVLNHMIALGDTLETTRKEVRITLHSHAYHSLRWILYVILSTA